MTTQMLQELRARNPKTIAEASAMHPQRLWHAHPTHWIGEEDGKLWLFHAAPNGWGRRAPYRGRTPSDKELVGSYNAVGCGYLWFERKESLPVKECI